MESNPGHPMSAASGRCRAVLYARVSTDRQREEATIDAQVDEIRRVAADRGHTISDDDCYVDDGYTGELLARPSLDRMRHAARERAFDILYVYDRGRLSRRFAYQELIIDELFDHSVGFYSLHDVVAVTPEDRIVQSMQGVFHEYERMKIIERFRLGKLHKVRSGRILGYVVRYGYTYVPAARDEDGYLRVNENEADIIRQIFQWVADEHLSLTGITRRLAQMGIRSRRSSSGLWSRSGLNSLLRDEMYIGRHYYNKTKAVLPKTRKKQVYRRIKRTSHERRPREEWIGLNVPAIVDRALWERVQRQLVLNRERSRRNAQREYLCQGLVYCRCGFRRGGCSSNGHRTYRCTERSYRVATARECKSAYVRADVLEPLVWEKVLELLTVPDTLRRYADDWRRQAIETQNAERLSRDQARSLAKANAAALAEETRYARAFGEGSMSAEVYRTVTAEVRQRREKLAARQAELSATMPRRIPSLDEVVSLAGNTLRKLDPNDRKHVISSLVTRIIADRERAVILGHLPFDPIATASLSPWNGETQDTNARFAIDTAPVVEQEQEGIPFSIEVELPAPDWGKKGYSLGFVHQLAAAAGLQADSDPLTRGQAPSV